MPKLNSAIPLWLFFASHLPMSGIWCLRERVGTKDHFFLLGLTFIKWMLLCNATKTTSKWGCNGSYYLSRSKVSSGLWLVIARELGLWLVNNVGAVCNLAIILFNTILHSPNPQNTKLCPDWWWADCSWSWSPPSANHSAGWVHDNQ